MTNNDDLDDPAWGSGPVREGALSDVLGWLRDLPSVDEYSVSIDSAATVWAADLLRPPH